MSVFLSFSPILIPVPLVRLCRLFLQVLGRNDNSWDQGQLFISQDTAYLSPCGVAQTMLADAAGSTAVAVAADLGWSDTLDVFANSGAGYTTVKVVNYGAVPVAVDLRFAGCGTAPAAADVVTLQGRLTDQNTPANKKHVWPKPSRLGLAGGSAGYTFPAASFTTIAVNCTVPTWRGDPASNVAGSTCAFVAPPPPVPPTTFTWAGRSMAPSGLDGWQVDGNTLRGNAGIGHGRAAVVVAALPVTGAVHASVVLASPSGHGPLGPTSMLLRFNAIDKAIGPGCVRRFVADATPKDRQELRANRAAHFAHGWSERDAKVFILFSN